MSRMNQEDAVDRYVREQMDRQHIPGLSLAVVKNGEIVKAEGYGLADIEWNIPAAPDTVYQIGSITKQFTAVAVMMLVEEGKIALEESIACYQDGLPEAWSKATVRHLLDHTSGIKSYTSVPDLMLKSLSPTTREDVLALIADEPLEFAPGEQHAYNNTGYYLLGHIIERAAERSYADFLQERLFAPLGMDATRVNDMKEIIPRRARGYAWTENRLSNADRISMTWPFAAGALVSTALDLAKWDAALLSEALLSKASWERMWTPTTLTDGTRVDYGFGWGLGDYHGHRVVGHGGGIPGFITFAERYPEDGLSVVVLTNLSPSNPVEIARGAAGQYVADLLPTNQLTPGDDPDPRKTEDLKTVAASTAGDADAPMLTDGYRAQLVKMKEDEKARRAEWINNLTEFSFITEKDVHERGVLRNGEAVSTLRFHKMVSGEVTRYWTFYLTAGGKAAGIVVE